MSRSTHQAGQLARVVFPIFNASNALVTGRAGSITKNLLKDGAADATVVTVTEDGTSGIYSATFTPAAAGHWYLLLRDPTNAPRGYDHEFDVTTDGMLTVNGIADGVLDRALGGSAGTRTLRHLGRRLLAVLFGRSSGMVAGQATASAKWYGEDDATVVVDGALDVNGNRTVKPTVNDA